MNVICISTCVISDSALVIYTFSLQHALLSLAVQSLYILAMRLYLILRNIALNLLKK
jgi:hypothetical protein